MRALMITVAWVVLMAGASMAGAQSAGPLSGAVYQYSVPAESRRAFLWIPPECTQVRGIILSMANLLERCWLEDTGGMEPDTFEPASYDQYKGDPKRAYWFFDEETACAAKAFCGDRKKRERQMLTFVQDGVPLPVARQGFAALRFQPEQDGLTFRLKADFLTEVPAELVGADRPLGHAQGSITFRVITGPAVQTGPDTFRIQFDREGMDASLWFQEEHPGNDQYRRAVQPGKMQIPARLTAGRIQAITFPQIQDQKVGTRTIALQATSDCGLPVDYYVVAGPAVLDGTRLILTDIPVKSRYPVKVTVVAYQRGRIIEPLIQSAEPVERTFLIVRGDNP